MIIWKRNQGIEIMTTQKVSKNLKNQKIENPGLSHNRRFLIGYFNGFLGFTNATSFVLAEAVAYHTI